MPSLLDLTRGKAILVCVGSGGVGKTTTAAAIGLRGACEGRRTLILTIDPARRLADSLGVGPLGHDPKEVPAERLRAAGLEPRAPVHAMMLDAHRTFEELVKRFASDPEARARLLGNPIYQQIAGRLAGTQEYAAIAEVHRLHRLGAYDLIVVDTPPSASALDFLEAPEKLADALDSPALQWFIRPTLLAGEFSVRMLGMGGAFVLRRLARITGSAFLEDVAHFLVEFNTLLGGFRRRADEVAGLFRDANLAFVVVATPEPPAVDDAIALMGHLRDQSMNVAAVIVNRMPLACRLPDGWMGALARTPSLVGMDPAEVAEAADALRTSCEEMARLAAETARQIDRLVGEIPELQPILVPGFRTDVHDLKGLAALGAQIYHEDG